MQKFACAIAVGYAAIWTVARWGCDWLGQLQSALGVPYSLGDIVSLHVVYDFHLAAMLVLLPTLAALLAGLTMHAFSPRVAFLPKGMTWRHAVLLAGLIIPLSLLMAVCVDVYGDMHRVVPAFASAFAFPAASAITTFLILLGTRRLRPGLCTSCRYDITHSINFNRCPECGTAIMQSA